MADKKTYYYLKLKEGFFDSEDMLLLQGIRMWYRMLGDLDYKLCETALMELFATHTYPPQI